MPTGDAKGAAHDAGVSTVHPADAAQEYRERIADEAEDGVRAIRAKLHGWQHALKAAEQRAQRLRKEAPKGRTP